MIYAAAQALTELASEHQPGASLLPTMRNLRIVAATVAKAVAETTKSQGLARRPLANPIQDIYGRIWKPGYSELRIVQPALGTFTVRLESRTSSLSAPPAPYVANSLRQ